MKVINIYLSEFNNLTKKEAKAQALRLLPLLETFDIRTDVTYEQITKDKYEFYARIDDSPKAADLLLLIEYLKANPKEGFKVDLFELPDSPTSETPPTPVA